jgi:hypothetical protein
MNTTQQGILVAGQITAYASSVLGAQYRTHVFFILILKNVARLIRWDHGSAVVTAPIEYDKEPFLLDFLIRYNHASPEACSHDVTVASPTDDENREVRMLPDFEKAKSLLVITMPDSHQPQETNRYVVCGPCARPDIPAGRWTQASIAYDLQRKKCVLLKDSWWVLLDGILPEGDVYAILHTHRVPNIPLCSCFGDVGDDTYHKSRTHKFIGKYKFRLSLPLTPHRHYCLILDTIGRKLEDFKCSREMVHAVHALLLSKLTDR